MRRVVAIAVFLCVPWGGFAEELIHTPIGDFTQGQINKMRTADPFDDPKCQGDTEPSLKTPMVFFRDKAAACLGNAAGFPTRAVGTITKATPKALEEFLAANDGEGTIEFTSAGGDLLAAMRLGEIIRQHQLNTSLGEVCASACAYAFLGGVKRYAVSDTTEIPEYFAPGNDDRPFGMAGDKLGIHQFYEREMVANLDAPAFTGTQRLEDQATLGQVAAYTIRMGVNPDMVIAASQVPPNKIRWLTVAERVGMGIDNTAVRYTPVGLYPFGAKGAYAGVTNSRQGSENAIRLYCAGKAKDLRISLIFDQSGRYSEDNLLGLIAPLQAEITTKDGQKYTLPFTIADSGQFEEGGRKKIAVALTIAEFPLKSVENLTNIAFVDPNQALGRADWPFLGLVEFRVRGDTRYLKLAMRNCI